MINSLTVGAFLECIEQLMTCHLPTTLNSRAQNRLRSLIARRRVEIYSVVWRVYSACRFVFVLALVELDSERESKYSLLAC